jgi:hypothetical protein
VDPFSLLLLAQGAVSAIKQGVDFLHQGRIALESTKKTVDGVVADVKAIKNIFDWFIGLFASKPKAETAKPVAKAAAKSKPSAAKQKSYEQLETELIKEIGENIGLLFDTQQQINTYYEELEEDSKANYDPTQNTSKKAIERVIIQLELEKLMESTREAMVYSPPACKDLYSRFLLMYGKIEQEQKWARAEMIRRARLARWRKEQEEIRQIEMTTGAIAVMFISLFFGWFMWAIQNLSGGF